MEGEQTGPDLDPLPDSAVSRGSQVTGPESQDSGAASQDPRPAAPAVELSGVTKRFGATVAVDNASFTIGQGELFGFIGPNGAGKTTTIKMIATLMPIDRGSIRVLGHDVRTQGTRVRRLIGYMPDLLGAYPELTVWEFLDFFAATYGMPARKRRGVIDELFQLADLGDKAQALVGSLSRGMQQRLSLARALVHDPKVLLLDEPASGLDPRARIELRAILGELKNMGKTILISSHILTELSEICTQIGIIERGRMVYCGDLHEALEQGRTRRRARVKVAGDLDAAQRQLEKCALVLSVNADEDELVVEMTAEAEDIGFIADALVGAGVKVLALREEEASLEEAFMRLTRGIVA